ncbi:MAG: TlyA family RNA methyltransferase [Oscillospiraceae bacterium]|nr:TlyA family RNA methyltransferase [Oscillospiraceae bacterium]
MAKRADIALTERGLCTSRSRAKLLIGEGKVLCDGIPVTKPSALIGDAQVLAVTEDLPFVGRGGLKLAGALAAFPVSLAGRVCMDIGASTGGFTDCMLQQGAARVYAVDVGHGQLAQALRNDSRVSNLEGTDVRELSPADLPETPDFCGIDVSFISLRLVLPAVYALLAEHAVCMALIKPQFEAGRSDVGKGGIVRSRKAHLRVLKDVLETAQAAGFGIQGVCVSPIRGGDGNAEYLVCLTKGDDCPASLPELQHIVETVEGLK